MKKILLLAVSTLVGTSASSLKPVFTNNLVSNGFKSRKLNNKDISIQNENSVNPFINKIKTLDDNSNVSSSVKSSNGTMYVGTYKSGLYKSADGITFEKVNGLPPNDVSDIATFNKTVYVSTQKSGLWKSIDGITFIKTSFVGLYTSSIATDSNGNVYVENLGVLYKSADGITFESIKTVPNDVEDISTFGKIVYVGTEKKVYGKVLMELHLKK